MSAPYVVATREVPAVRCPTWCNVAQEDHLANLANLEGFVVHHSQEIGRVSVSVSATPDGKPNPEEPEPLVWLDGHEMSMTEARELAAVLLEAYEIAADEPLPDDESDEWRANVPTARTS